MSGPGRRNPNMKKGTRRPPQPPAPDNYKVQFDPHFMQQQHVPLQNPRNAYPYNFRHLQANAPGTQYDKANAAENRPYMNSRPNTTFDSPEPHHVQIGQYGAPDFQGSYHNPYNIGLGIQYDEYGLPMYDLSNAIDYRMVPGISRPPYEQQHGSAYYTHPGIQQPQYPAPVGYYGNSPPTPAASDQGGGRKRTKGNNRPIAPHESTETPRVTPDDVPRSGRVPRRKASEKPVKPGKSVKTTKGKREIPPLTAPLSELTKSYDHIPIKNMNEWVNRSLETRLKECGKKEKGYIPRPMNSFMMYRSAYAERTKHWCLQNNHQVVSSVSGESWPMEPPEIKDLYIEYAKQERENHAKAHPEYKFSPTKTDASRRKRKGAKEEGDDDDSIDLKEPDYDWQPSKNNKNIKRNGRAKNTKPLSRTSNHPVNLEFQDEFEAHAVSGPSPSEQSTFEFNNPGRDCPPQLESLQYGEYYETVINSNPLGTTRVEDVSLHKAEVPLSHYEYPQPLVGLPGAHHHELLDQQFGEDDLKAERRFDVAIPLDPQLDPLFSDSFDLNQLGSLDSFTTQKILQELNQDLFETGDGTVDPQLDGNQQGFQNEAELEYQKSSRSENLNEYQNGYQNVYQDLYQNECPDGDQDEQQPEEYPNLSENVSYPEELSPKALPKPEKLVHEPEKLVHEPEKLVHEPEKLVHEPEKLVHEPEKLVRESEKLVRESGKLVQEPEKLIHEPEKLIHEPEKHVHEPEKLAHEPSENEQPSNPEK